MTMPGFHLRSRLPLLFVATGVALMLCGPLRTAFARTPLPEGTVERIDRYLRELESGGFSGAFLLAQGDEVLLAAGYGHADAARGIANTPATVFGTASVTKQFTAAAIVRLEQLGLLDVDDPLTAFFDDVPADKSEITLHQLLTHTSGLPGSLGQDDEPLGREEMVARAMATPLVAPPGADYLYSDVGYNLLAAVIEIVSGRSNDAVLKTELFDPAGMTDSGYRLDVPAERLAHGYDRFSGADLGSQLERPGLDDGPYWLLRGAGGVHTTIGDMFAWDRLLAGDEVLSAAARAKLFAPHVAIEDGVHYGYGWGVVETERGTTLLTHSGGSPFTSSQIRRYPDDDVFVYLVSNAGPRAPQIGGEIARALFDPDYEMVVPGVATDGELPDSPAGRRAGDWIALIDGADDDAIRTFVTDFLDEGFLRDSPVEEWVAFFRGLQAELEHPELVSVEVLDPFQLIFTLRSATNGNENTFLLFVEPRPPHRLVGLDIR